VEAEAKGGEGESDVRGDRNKEHDKGCETRGAGLAQDALTLPETQGELFCCKDGSALSEGNGDESTSKDTLRFFVATHSTSGEDSSHTRALFTFAGEAGKHHCNADDDGDDDDEADCSGGCARDP
jgi:hypothetical protein